MRFNASHYIIVVYKTLNVSRESLPTYLVIKACRLANNRHYSPGDMERYADQRLDHFLASTPDQPQHLASNNNLLHSTQRKHIMSSMFGALNRFISRLDAAPGEQQSATQGAYGFQVLRNTNPEVPLDPWFDFIIGINGRTLVRAPERSGSSMKG